MDKPLLRASEINSYLKCSAEYMFQHIEKIRTPNKLVLAFGTSVHEALARNYRQKIETKFDLPAEDVVETFADNFDLGAADVETMDILEPIGQVKDRGVRLVDKYQKEVAPRIQPLHVERTMMAQFAGYDYGVKGTVDLIDDDNNLIDHKTTHKNHKDIWPGYRRQLSQYALLIAANKEPLKDTRLDILVATETPEIHHYKVEPDLEHTLALLQNVGEGIKHGIFIPNRDSFLCSRRQCRYWEACEKRYGGTIKP